MGARQENLVARARWGADGAVELVEMLQSVAYLANAYAVESVHGGRLDAAAELLEKAEELTRKRLMRHCAALEYARAGLRASTYNTRALLFRRQALRDRAYRSLQLALKVGRPGEGCEGVPFRWIGVSGGLGFRVYAGLGVWV